MRSASAPDQHESYVTGGGDVSSVHAADSIDNTDTHFAGEAATRNETRLLDQLAHDNEVLRNMLRRALGPSFHKVEQSVVSATAHIQAQLDRKDAELRGERERRTIAESLLGDVRRDHESYVRTKDSELRKLQDALVSVRNENRMLKERSQEDGYIIIVLKRENQRLLELTRLCDKRGNPMPTYNNCRQERLRADVPSYAKNIGHIPPAAVKRAFPLLVGRRGSSPAASIGAGVRSGSYADGGSLRSRSPAATTTNVNNAVVRPTVGQRCTWRGMQGIVRYIGPVDRLKGVFAGIELHRGQGDHDGTIHGVQYFTAAPESSVFCPLREVQPSRDTPRVPHVASTRSTPRSVSRQQPKASSHEDVNQFDSVDVAQSADDPYSHEADEQPEEVLHPSFPEERLDSNDDENADKASEVQASTAVIDTHPDDEIDTVAMQRRSSERHQYTPSGIPIDEIHIDEDVAEHEDERMEERDTLDLTDATVNDNTTREARCSSFSRTDGDEVRRHEYSPVDPAEDTPTHDVFVVAADAVSHDDEGHVEEEEHRVETTDSVIDVAEADAPNEIREEVEVNEPPLHQTEAAAECTSVEEHDPVREEGDAKVVDETQKEDVVAPAVNTEDSAPDS